MQPLLSAPEWWDKLSFTGAIYEKNNVKRAELRFQKRRYQILEKALESGKDELPNMRKRIGTAP